MPCRQPAAATGCATSTEPPRLHASTRSRGLFPGMCRLHSITMARAPIVHMRVTPSGDLLSASCCRARSAVRPLTAAPALRPDEAAAGDTESAAAVGAAAAAAAGVFAAAGGAAAAPQPRGGAGVALLPAVDAAPFSRSPRRKRDRPPLRCALLLLLRACTRAQSPLTKVENAKEEASFRDRRGHMLTRTG